MKFRLHYESDEIEAKDRDDAITKYFAEKVLPPIAKILPIDKDGFPIK